MKTILLALMIMFCMAGNRSYANEWVSAYYPYVYAPAPVIVNVPTPQTLWVPVTTVIQQPAPVYYYPYVSYVEVVHQPAPVIQRHRCWWFENHRRY